ncbi:MAG: hypothetical protein ACYTBJ_22575 [Planctomycetota bacterium]
MGKGNQSAQEFWDYINDTARVVGVFVAFVLAAIITHFVAQLIRVPVMDSVFKIVAWILLAFGAVTCVVFAVNRTWRFLRGLGRTRPT